MSNENQGVRAKIQRFGSYLSSMIMPNIGAFIAWGLITALFIPDGWLPNENLVELVDPMIIYLLPLLIGFTGGKLVYGVRGGVVGATATMGVIVGTDIPMFIGAMLMGPLGGYLIKKLDSLWEGKIRQGFEMLVNNFSAGILGGLLTIIAYIGVGPIVEGLNNVLASGVEAIVAAGLLPFASIIIEPAKVLFLNNAINHGILGPIGIDQASETGKSILFMLETNPGPGLGILLAYMIFGAGAAKRSAPGAGIIHFFGGIHEIYFPYILMKPSLLIAVIFGGMGGILTFVTFGVGLRATPSPGSIFAYFAMTPGGDYIGMLAGIIVATAISFAIAGFILKASKNKGEGDLMQATSEMEAMKGKKSDSAEQLKKDATELGAEDVTVGNINKIIFACDAGMGSSAMGASLLKDKVKKAGIEGIEVTNKAINDLPEDVDLVVTHKDLTERARAKRPEADHISVENFLNSPEYDKLVEKLKNQ
ncbi:PTS mannitol transporter subunit IICB [Salisediminibacterium halotolerans]|uniref:PTS mannitol transporter subunit IICB n=1 Tax=Salisediminibacterium halotolerans TaxID=517425 RepID=UPI000EB0ED1D|nr:PTS mannitol transporter subunit IICB [Salisediminibacterium halotolerans]RLJ73188.1 PTS system D-mannitol-specific IIB component (Fru family) /PTS system D-mannitol-specific IIC component (Fru family) [Actinophytocola xinjiangensis]RPE86610.1 PTS system D-mannitol-specific IIB component (Fru family) /PTS system D-mannitol-specific IIC component (Fru family) [Salisediminibacterium halotolerans]TWG33985.1 PTS system D-mannitol-specific IIB component (Fru family) /PTS system D-mannitol-specific